VVRAQWVIELPASMVVERIERERGDSYCLELATRATRSVWHRPDTARADDALDQVRALDALCASATTDAAGHAVAVVRSIAASAS
jgi:hypothetical protein